MSYEKIEKCINDAKTLLEHLQSGETISVKPETQNFELAFSEIEGAYQELEDARLDEERLNAIDKYKMLIYPYTGSFQPELDPKAQMGAVIDNTMQGITGHAETCKRFIGRDVRAVLDKVLENEHDHLSKELLYQIGNKFKFPVGNQIVFGQDHAAFSGVPSDEEFEITKVLDTTGKVQLTASGFGGEPYVNGSIYISEKDLIQYGKKVPDTPDVHRTRM